MRLSEEQIDGIIETFNLFFREGVELRLYGSRAKDNLRGGDIDLLLRIEDPKITTEFREKKHPMLVALKKKLGDQKIDLLIISKKDSEQDPFVQMILPDSVLIKRW